MPRFRWQGLSISRPVKIPLTPPCLLPGLIASIAPLLGIPSPNACTLPPPNTHLHSTAHRKPSSHPSNHQSIVVEGRPARVRVVTAVPPPTHEDWVIVLIVPMPNLPVDFNTIRDVLTDFFTDKQLGFSEIVPCPFGQAYIYTDVMSL